MDQAFIRVSVVPGKSTLLCWPAALRRVRAWLEPWVILGRYWRTFSDKPPLNELGTLL
jgi:hypothetical protein